MAMSNIGARSRRQKTDVTIPPADLSADSDEKLFRVARRVFLERGLSGSSFDEIARLARIPKSTLYVRFPTKEALFVAVGIRNAQVIQAGFAEDEHPGNTFEECLVSVGKNILRRILVKESVDFMRLAQTEVRRFPETADYGRTVQKRSAQVVRDALAGIAKSQGVTYPAFAPERIEETTRFFLDLVMLRLYVRALAGEDMRSLRAEIDGHAARAVSFFVSGCRSSPQM